MQRSANTHIPKPSFDGQPSPKTENQGFGEVIPKMDSQDLIQAAVAALVVVASLCMAAKLYLSRQHHSKIPRGFTTKKMIDASAMPKNKTIINDIYATRKLPDDIDYIVIGSGIGGLTCAGMLSRAGQRCLVLEQHYIAGGNTRNSEQQRAIIKASA